MNGFLLAIAFLLAALGANITPEGARHGGAAALDAAPGRICALSHFQVPPPANTEKPAKVIPHPQTSARGGPASGEGLEKAAKQPRGVTAPYSRSRTVMPVLLEYLPYAQALQERIPGITATPLPYNKNSMIPALVIPLAPEDLPVQSQKQKEDMRDALAPAQSSYGQALAGTKRCTPKGIKRCKSRYRLSWWTRILPVPAFNVLLQKLHFPLSKAPELKTGKFDKSADAPSFADEIFSQ